MKNLKKKFGKFAVSKEEMAVLRGGSGASATLDDIRWICEHTDGKESTHDTLGSASSYCQTDSTCISCHPA